MSLPSARSPASDNSALLPFAWALLVSKVIFLVGIPLAIVLLVAPNVFHLALPRSTYMVAIALAFLSMAVGQIVRMRLLFLTGRWRALSGEMVRREERPDRFRKIVALHGVVMLAYLGVVAMAIWIVAGGA